MENDDGIWLKLSKDSVKKYCDAEVESWTLAVAVSGRIYLAQEGDTTYQSQVIDTSAPPAPAQMPFPTAASVFGTPPQKSVFGAPLVPSPPTFQFGTLKLQFGSSTPLPTPKPPVYKFGKPEKRKVVLVGGRSRLRRKLRSAVIQPSKSPLFKGGGEGEREESASSLQQGGENEEEDKTPSPKGGGEDEEEAKTPSTKEEGGEEEDEEKTSNLETEEAPLPPPPTAPDKKALSPAVAECQRAVYAAFLWQEGLVHDAIVSASYLKFHPELSKEMKREQKTHEKEKAPEKKEGEEGGTEKQESEGGKETGEGEGGNSNEEEGEKGDKKSDKKDDTVKKSPGALVLSPEQQDAHPSSLSLLPATLNHLVTFWDEISSKVLDSSSAAFPAPKVPPLAQELQKRYEEEKKEIEKRKKEKDKKASVQVGGGNGTTLCELCEQSFPDPVTYHMKDAHPGCGKHASGWGYNSRGTFCSGWAGNCGDGGRGGSTWYLMCKDCHAKYLAMKSEVKKKTVRIVPLPKMKTKKPGKPRSLPVLSAIQGMIQNAKFLLEISCPTDNKLATTPTAILSPSQVMFSKQSSLSAKPDADTRKSLFSETGFPDPADPTQRPMFLRSTSLLGATSPLAASASSESMRPLRTMSSDVKDESSIVRQRTMDSPLSVSESMAHLPLKPSINLARLMYNRSKHSAESKEIGYGKVMAFVLQYHDLNGLRIAMKQSMRVAGIRAFAMEVRKLPVHVPSVITHVCMISVKENAVFYIYVHVYPPCAFYTLPLPLLFPFPLHSLSLHCGSLSNYSRHPIYMCE